MGKTGTKHGAEMSQEVEPRHISVELAGGLGNQLFTYVAGIYIAHKLGSRVRIFLHESLAKSPAKGRGIAAFKGVAEVDPGLNNTHATSPKSARWIGLISSWLQRIGLSRLASQRITSFYQSSVIGEDSDINSIGNGFFIRGYFQTRKYYQEISDTLLNGAFELKEPSPWFKQLKRDSIQSSPVVVHVRRGDYLNEQNSFIGALSPDYFLEAISMLRQDPEMQDREIWIFSNDIPFVKGELEAKLDGSVRWIEPPPQSPEAESLLLLGSGSALVMSNSTFSWWAATLGKPSRVIAPSKWFKAAEDPTNLLMPDWNQLESRWIE